MRDASADALTARTIADYSCANRLSNSVGIVAGLCTAHVNSPNHVNRPLLSAAAPANTRAPVPPNRNSITKRRRHCCNTASFFPRVLPNHAANCRLLFPCVQYETSSINSVSAITLSVSNIHSVGAPNLETIDSSHHCGTQHPPFTHLTPNPLHPSNLPPRIQETHRTMAARPATPASPKNHKVRAPQPGQPMYGCGRLCPSQLQGVPF